VIEPADTRVSLDPLRETDFPMLAQVARTIWLSHYITIISQHQIEYMLGNRFAPDHLRRYIASIDRWLEVLNVSGEMVGYCSYALTTVPGEMKLEQLYLLPLLHGRGLGRLMLEHVQRRTQQQDCRTLMLQVNKRNDKAINVYKRAGFALRQEVVVDIGNGFVMDDYIMEKHLYG
jgi:ribosomal protein S18 acetylase RimI-like enzyme